MKMKAAYLGLCLLASADAAQFTQTFLEFSASEAKPANAFDEWKESMTRAYEPRRLSHTLPSFIVPRDCNYSAINHTPTSTTPVDQMVCPDRCGAGRTFTLRIETQCDRPYQEAGRVCSSVITCAVTGCTSGAQTCPPVELLDLDAALDEACTALCGSAPAPSPVVAPVPVVTPVIAPVVPPNTAPAPAAIPPPVVSPVIIPTAPVAIPTTPVFMPSPIAGPVAPVAPVAPVFAPVPDGTPTMDPVSGKRTSPYATSATVPVYVPVASIPVEAPVTLPTVDATSVGVNQQSAPNPQPVLTTSDIAPQTESSPVASSRQSVKNSKKSKKSKSVSTNTESQCSVGITLNMDILLFVFVCCLQKSSYCDDGSGKSGKRCLKRKST